MVIIIWKPKSGISNQFAQYFSATSKLHSGKVKF